MPEFSYGLKIPKERIAVLIGKKGRVKNQIEEATGIKLSIDSNEGDIELIGTDALKLYTATEIIQAVGRGFNPKLALQLLKGDYVFDQIHLAETARNQNDLERIKGRLIGTDGKCRRIIEELSEADVCVYGKTVSIIGRPESVVMARKAVEQIIKGSQHRNVYKWLESRRRELKRRSITGFDIGQ